jgi:hypothetical protein
MGIPSRVTARVLVVSKKRRSTSTLSGFATDQ